jgi:aminoglycoside phosphotransferase (APT) family kinase protein
MTMGRAGRQAISEAAISAYLENRVDPAARLLGLETLGESAASETKSYGYGRPLRIRYEVGGVEADRVLRTMSPDPFGHERRADRAQVLLQSVDSFNQVPRHIHALDAGFIDEAGNLIPAATGEPFLITDFVPGELYAADLEAIRARKALTRTDLDRARALATYLAEVHSAEAPEALYARHLRDVVGSGEGIFGLTESYPVDRGPSFPTPSHLERLEQLAVSWRWKLRPKSERCRRIHGDFHPFNILFRQGAELSVLDASRGSAGEPADDVTCLSINYLFFALLEDCGFEGPFFELWTTFWDTYFETRPDPEMLGLVAPFFAWRALVLASPIWYPNISHTTRGHLLTFATRLLEGARFEPRSVGALL